ncbi:MULTISPECIES: HEPN domain-containing protein [unclassified Streptomyces]|uniref:ApeA N-terminal domain 1-containing protein n=1 Tax=unclassified Streptomyces TaxID=2593676 RepID=UPI0036CF8017
MEAFETDGLFWLPGRSEETIGGRINFDPVKGVKLSLIGSFSDSEFSDDLDDGPDQSIIHGVAGKRFLMLLDCRVISSRFDFPGFKRDDHRAGFMLASRSPLDPDELKIERVSFSLSNMFDWVGLVPVSRNFHVDEETGRLIDYSLTLTPPSPVEHDASGCKISISGTWKVLGGKQNPGFESGFSLDIHYETPADFSTARSDVSVLQDLVTATAGSVAFPTKIVLRIPGVDEGEPVKIDAQLYGAQVAQPSEKRRKSSDMLLTLQQIGGLSAVARWFDFLRSRRVVLGLMLSSVYNGALYTENKFFNAVSAAETLHRMEFPNEVRPAAEYKAFKRLLAGYVPEEHQRWLMDQLAYSNEPRLRQRLIDLAEFSGLADVIGCDAELWAKAVTNARNRMVHHDEKRGRGAKSSELYWLSESLKILTLLCLARFCEFQDGCKDILSENDSVAFMAEQVAQIVGGRDT